MTTKQDIAALEAQLATAKAAYHRSVISEVEKLNARLLELQAELGDVEPAGGTRTVVHGGVYGPKEPEPAKPAPKNALRLVKPPRKTRTPTGRNMVLDALSTGPTTIQDIADATGRTHNTVWFQLKQLVRSGAVRRDDTQMPHVYNLASDKPKASPSGITREQMELLTALASGPKSLVPLTLNVLRNHRSVEADLAHLKARGLVRELTNTEPSRWEMVQGASAGVAK